MATVVLLMAGMVFATYSGVRYFADTGNRAFSAAQWREVRASVRRSRELPEDAALRALIAVDRRIGG